MGSGIVMLTGALLLAFLPMTAVAQNVPHKIMTFNERVVHDISQAATVFAPKDWPTDAPSFRQVLSAVILQESSGCLRNMGDHGHAFGCGQIHLATARIIVGAPVSKWVLMHNVPLNIRMTAWYLADNFKQTGSWLKAIYAYNHGLPSALRVTDWRVKHDRYVRKIEQRTRE